MSPQLQLQNHPIQTTDILSVVQRYQLMPQVLRGIVIDRAIAHWQQTTHDHRTGTDAERLERFKQAMFSHQVEPYFLKRKSTLDQVVYSLIRTKELELTNELYFRILEGEQTFAEVARQYSEGPEASTGGLLGPVPLSQPHAAIAHLLTISKPGQLWMPRFVADWFVILRLEKRHSAQLNATLRQQLLNELFENWLQQEIQKVR
jgi:parvulin-like peptidyl-prolyl isomerase